MTVLRTPEEVAAHLGLKKTEVRRLAATGEVEHVRAGRGKILFTEEQATALVQHMTQHPRSRTPSWVEGPDYFA